MELIDKCLDKMPKEYQGEVLYQTLIGLNKYIPEPLFSQRNYKQYEIEEEEEKEDSQEWGDDGIKGKKIELVESDGEDDIDNEGKTAEELLNIALIQKQKKFSMSVEA